jgi:hypothetical protein
VVQQYGRVAVRVGCGALLLIALGCARLAPQLIAGSSGHHAAAVPATSLTTVPNSADLDIPRELEEEGEMDLYGNDVTAAVASYRLDAAGTLYEAHSPQTQLPKLGPPKS